MSSTAPRIIFMGTAEFGVRALRALHERFGVAAVVTLPDKPAGRGLQLHASAVKACALELGIETLLQPSSLRDADFQAQLRTLQPDIICVIAFRILPREVYECASIASFNVHASLLPKFRGAAPINHAIIQGEEESGVTAFVLNDVVDTGNLLLQRRCPISENMTAGELYAALMPLAAEAAVASVELLLQDNWKALEQEDAAASAAPKVWREKSGIDWNQSTRDVRNFIHGMSPTPCAWTNWDNDRLKIYRVESSQRSLDPGTWEMSNDAWSVGCADGSINLIEIQMPGKGRVQVSDFLRGWRGDRKGSFVLTTNQ